MNILVTGGLGVVGMPLVAELKKRSHNVAVVDKIHSHLPEYFRCDVGEYRQIEDIFLKHGPFDYVYHLAAEFGRWNGEDFYETLWRSNVVGTKNLIRLQEKLGFKMIAASSSEVYGDYSGVMEEEVMVLNPIRQMNDYAMTKWVNEMQIMNSSDLNGTSTVRVRLFNTYGPGEYYSPYRSCICLFVYNLLHNRPIKVFLNHTRTSSYIDDTVWTLANIVDNFRAGEVYNIAGKDLHDMKTASDIILGLLGKNDSLVEYYDAEPATTLHKRVSSQKALADLGHRSTITLEEGIKRTIEWQREVYGIVSR